MNRFVKKLDQQHIFMILSDRDIKKLLEKGDLIIEPFEESQLQPSGVDLHLGEEFAFFSGDYTFPIDPFDKDLVEDLLVRVKKEPGTPVVIPPGEFILATTREWIRIPPYVMGLIQGRSSLARLGILVHVTAGFADPGFEGKLVLELSNVGKFPVRLYPGMRICKIVFHKLSSPAEKPYRGKYQKQTHIIASRLFEEALSIKEEAKKL